MRTRKFACLFLVLVTVISCLCGCTTSNSHTFLDGNTDEYLNALTRLDYRAAKDIITGYLSDNEQMSKKQLKTENEALELLDEILNSSIIDISEFKELEPDYSDEDKGTTSFYTDEGDITIKADGYSYYKMNKIGSDLTTVSYSIAGDDSDDTGTLYYVISGDGWRLFFDPTGYSIPDTSKVVHTHIDINTDYEMNFSKVSFENTKYSFEYTQAADSFFIGYFDFSSSHIDKLRKNTETLTVCCQSKDGDVYMEISPEEIQCIVDFYDLSCLHDKLIEFAEK